MNMKSLLIGLSLTLAAGPTLAEVGVSVTVGEPGFFGHIEIGDAPRPVLLAPQAVIIERAPRAVVVEPLYLYVPRRESSDWRRNCSRYQACGRPVYFVSEGWYRDVYVPHYHKRRKEYDGRHGGQKNHKQKQKQGGH
jgi:hypothetical protein